MQQAKDAIAPLSQQLTAFSLEVKMNRFMFLREAVAQAVKLLKNHQITLYEIPGTMAQMLKYLHTICSAESSSCWNADII